MTTLLFPVILAGGSGTRLWPLSRKNFPKQFLHLQGERSLLQQTAERAISLPHRDMIIVTNVEHYFLCQEQLQEFSPNITYLLEPCSRNTAPAIATAAHYIESLAGRNAMMAILPSDHWISDIVAFRDAMLLGAEFLGKNPALVTFGVTPSAPKTGYGYIEASQILAEGVYAVNCFREKPDEKTAEAFIASGNYYWNSGMFLCTVGTYLDELKEFAPDIFKYSKEAVNKAHRHHHYLRLEEVSFASCPSESIDYAVMEKTLHAKVIPVNMPWSDLGCWTSVAEANPLDENGNTLQGKVIVKETSDCLVSSKDILTTTLGIHDLIVVATSDAVLVADKKYSQQVKDLVQDLAKEHAQLANEHSRVPRPWGYYEVLLEAPTFKVKRLMVKPGAQLSLQKHQHRAEHWVVVAGLADVICGGTKLSLATNQSTYIPQNTLHRLGNSSSDPLYVIELQTGVYLGEDDIMRYDDIYERQLTSTLVEMF
jgi:mannose-1-phosphate guanylyltransferase/mannose-6-phosphate isomerase